MCDRDRLISTHSIHFNSSQIILIHFQYSGNATLLSETRVNSGPLSPLCSHTAVCWSRIHRTSPKFEFAFDFAVSDNNSNNNSKQANAEFCIRF